MAISWLTNALSTKEAPHKTVIDILRKNMAGWDKARDHTTVHASDVTKKEFCPKQLALLDITGKKKKDQYINTALRATFDVGNMTSDLFRERWAGDAAHGFWKCSTCGTVSSFGVKPKHGCKNHPSDWRYQEPNFVSTEYHISGSVDVCLDLDSPKLYVTELKIMAPTEFEKLAAPLAEHRIRTNLYMKLIDDSKSPIRQRFNLSEARVVYVSRAFGKKHELYGEILPFKEFVVTRDDEALTPYLSKAAEVKWFKETGKIPAGICGTSSDTIAKSCSVCSECFSGNYPQGLKWKKEELA
jgi:hypothetical protein